MVSAYIKMQWDGTKNHQIFSGFNLVRVDKVILVDGRMIQCFFLTLGNELAKAALVNVQGISPKFLIIAYSGCHYILFWLDLVNLWSVTCLNISSVLIPLLPMRRTGTGRLTSRRLLTHLLINTAVLVFEKSSVFAGTKRFVATFIATVNALSHMNCVDVHVQVVFVVKSS